MLKLQSVKTRKLSNKLIRKICNLRDEQWKFGIKSQLEHFKKNIKSNDIHNCFYINNKLIGYTLLRKRKFILQNKKSSYLLFDTLIIRKDLRKKKLSSLMMLFNNNVILKQKEISFLICKNELVNFYKKFSWIKVKNKVFKIKDHYFNSNGMFFNFDTRKLDKMRKIAEIYINQQ